MASLHFYIYVCVLMRLYGEHYPELGTNKWTNDPLGCSLRMSLPVGECIGQAELPCTFAFFGSLFFSF